MADSERALGPVVDWEPPPSTSNKRLMPGPFSRPMTPTELTLLTAFGFTPTTAITEVDYQSRGIRVRTWAGIA